MRYVSSNKGFDSNAGLSEHSDGFFFIDPVLFFEMFSEVTITQFLDDIVILFIFKHFDEFDDVFRLGLHGNDLFFEGEFSLFVHFDWIIGRCTLDFGKELCSKDLFGFVVDCFEDGGKITCTELFIEVDGVVVEGYF